MMAETCDNKSVGVIIQSPEDARILLVNRVKLPYGWAAPAGHVDGHGSSIDTAIEEVSEETGLHIARESLTLVLQNRRVDGECSRGGTHHNWDVYTAPLPEGESRMKLDEVRGIMLVDQLTLRALHAQTQHATYEQPGLEPVWGEFLTELGYLGQPSW